MNAACEHPAKLDLYRSKLKGCEGYRFKLVVNVTERALILSFRQHFEKEEIVSIYSKCGFVSLHCDGT